jgi:hypothetical protein
MKLFPIAVASMILCQPLWATGVPIRHAPGPGEVKLYQTHGFNVAGSVNDIAEWIPPGASTPWLVIVGEFDTLDSRAGGTPTTVSVNYVAGWDGTNWRALDQGFNKEAFCIAVLGER